MFGVRRVNVPVVQPASKITGNSSKNLFKYIGTVCQKKPACKVGFQGLNRWMVSIKLLHSMNSKSTPATSSFRWIICALLFFSTTVNYMDRQVISHLKEFFCTPAAAGGFGWTNSDFANVTTVFTGFYAGMTILAGWVIDKIGTKLGLALSLIVWSVFGIANAFVGSLTVAHMIVRSAFGIGEAGNFPASIKTVAEWFPKRERALATGIFNSGANVGAILAPLTVPWIADHWGWQAAFLIIGGLGLLWLIFWFWLYEIPSQSKKVKKAEFDYIHIDTERDK